MKKLGALLKLEFSYLKTYWLYVLLFLGIAIVMGLASQDGTSFILSLIMFVVALTTFSFEFTDKSNLNILYGTLPTNRKSIVTARYIFFISILFIGAIVGLIGGIIINLVFSQEVDITILLSALAFSIGIYLILVGWIAPFLFKFGWQKGKLFFWVAIAIVIITINIGGLLNAVGVSNTFNIFEFFLRNLIVSSLVSLGIGGFVIAISFFASIKVYLKKNF